MVAKEMWALGVPRVLVRSSHNINLLIQREIKSPVPHWQEFYFLSGANKESVCDGHMHMWGRSQASQTHRPPASEVMYGLETTFLDQCNGL
jgi:hypothetical protein